MLQVIQVIMGFNLWNDAHFLKHGREHMRFRGEGFDVVEVCVIL